MVVQIGLEAIFLPYIFGQTGKKFFRAFGYFTAIVAHQMVMVAYLSMMVNMPVLIFASYYQPEAFQKVQCAVYGRDVNTGQSAFYFGIDVFGSEMSGLLVKNIQY